MTMGPVSPAAPPLKLGFGHEVFVLAGSSWEKIPVERNLWASRKVLLCLRFFLADMCMFNRFCLRKAAFAWFDEDLLGFTELMKILAHTRFFPRPKSTGSSVRPYSIMISVTTHTWRQPPLLGGDMTVPDGQNNKYVLPLCGIKFVNTQYRRVREIFGILGIHSMFPTVYVRNVEQCSGASASAKTLFRMDFAEILQSFILSY